MFTKMNILFIFSIYLLVFGSVNCENDTDINLCSDDWTTNFLVSIRENDFNKGEPFYKHICSGSLLSTNWILTAATCIPRHHGELFAVPAYLVDAVRYRGIAYRVAEQYIHEKYTPSNTSHNIQLMKLRDNIDVDGKVGIVELPRKRIEGDLIAQMAKVCEAVGKIGWGPILGNSTKLSKLHCGFLTVVEVEDCKKAFEEKNLRFDVEDVHLCVKPTEDKTIVFGDNGGPLMCGNIQVGILAVSGDEHNTPSLYVRTDAHLHWIGSKQFKTRKFFSKANDMKISNNLICTLLTCIIINCLSLNL